MNKNNQSTSSANRPSKKVKDTKNGPTINRHTRRKVKHHNRHHRKTSTTRTVTDDRIIYSDNSFVDRTKRVFSSGLAAARERIRQAKATFALPEKIKTERRSLRSSCLLVNEDGRPHELLPDRPSRHVLLVHRSVARALVSGVCMFVRVTASRDKDDNAIDGSWAMVPATYDMAQTTTIQHLRRRPFWFLRRYWFEISFDGRVQPAHLLFDYGLNPVQRRTRLHITREFVPVRNQDKTNDYFRFWLKKPQRKENSEHSEPAEETKKSLLKKLFTLHTSHFTLKP